MPDTKIDDLGKELLFPRYLLQQVFCYPLTTSPEIETLDDLAKLTAHPLEEIGKTIAGMTAHLADVLGEAHLERYGAVIDLRPVGNRPLSHSNILNPASLIFAELESALTEGGPTAIIAGRYRQAVSAALYLRQKGWSQVYAIDVDGTR